MAMFSQVDHIDLVNKPIYYAYHVTSTYLCPTYYLLKLFIYLPT